MPNMKKIIPVGKQIDRGRRCQNCIHYKWGKEEQEKIKRKLGLVGEIPWSTLSEQEAKGLKWIKMGVIGTCKFDSADTVTFNYLCDKWTGKTGSSLVTNKPDPLPEEFS